MTNPARDVRFSQEAHRHAADGADTPTELQRRLRSSYPMTRVHAGITDPVAERWYVYREGRWIGD